MGENGTAYAAALTIRHLLRLLENKGLASSSEIRQLLDGVQGELREAGARGALSHDASIEASRSDRADVFALPRTGLDRHRGFVEQRRVSAPDPSSLSD